MIISRKQKCPHCKNEATFSRAKVGFFAKSLPLQCDFCKGKVVYSSKYEWLSISGFILVIGSGWFLHWNSLIGFALCFFVILTGAVLTGIAKRREFLVPYETNNGNP